MADVDQEPGARRRARTDDLLGVPWDGGAWVDADPHGRWRPTRTERLRSAVVLVVFFSILGLVAAIASVGGEGDDEPVSAATTSSTTTSVVTTTSTTAINANSVGGEAPPPACADDDREGRELRDPGNTTVMVLNGTPRNGHAGRNTDELKDQDYSTVAPGNARVRPFTSIEYVAGFCAEGVRLAADIGLPDAEVRPMPDDPPVVLGRAELLLTLGEDSL